MLIQLPLGAATHLSYQFKFVGGEYSHDEEVEYWRTRGARIGKDEVILARERTLVTLTIPEAADYLNTSENQIRRMIFETRELRRWQCQPALITLRELDRWCDSKMKKYPVANKSPSLLASNDNH